VNFEEFVQQECPEAVTSAIDWQHDFCLAHAALIEAEETCPFNERDCFLNRAIAAGTDIESLSGIVIGRGVTTDHVLEVLKEDSGTDTLLKNPIWWICVAEYLSNNPGL
jgi:hypothetical protein